LVNNSESTGKAKKPVDVQRREMTNYSTSALESEEEDGEEDGIRGIKSQLRQTKVSPRRRSSNLIMTPIKPKDTNQDFARLHGPPLLPNLTCSGYFLEPMKWMEPFLSSGVVAGKITCPNEKCGAKLGNFDWAGVMCSCKEWVTPGFCIARSKVDEVM